VSPTAQIAAALASLLRSRAHPAARAWFDAAWVELDAVSRRESFLTVLAGAGRRLGRETVEIRDAEGAALESAGFTPFPRGLGLDECGRGALLLKALEPLDAADSLEVASETYHRGEIRERQALLRVLAYLPSPAVFRELAVEACRTSAQDVFAAISCENPYPAAHFTEPSFNQMVLKAVFNGLALDRIAGLPHRVTADLVRMAEDFAAERRAAGRAIPDLHLILSTGTRSA
jgi:hypothetical protein